MAPTLKARTNETCGASASEANMPAAGDRFSSREPEIGRGVLFASSSAARESAIRIRIAVSWSLLLIARFI